MVENLTKLLQTETSNLAFATVPFHYVSIAKVLLDTAPDDIPNSDEVRARLKDLREARQSKVGDGLAMINPYHLEMTNIAYAELCELRAFFSTSFNHLRAMQNAPALPEGDLSSLSQQDLGASMGDSGVEQSYGGYYGNEESVAADQRPRSLTPTPGVRVPGPGEDSMNSNFSNRMGEEDDDGMGVAQWGGR